MRRRAEPHTRREGRAAAAFALGLALAVGAGVTYARPPAAPPETVVAPVTAAPARPAEEPGTTLRPSPEPTRPVRPGVPERIVVPRLGVDAPVVRSYAPGGTLQPPDDPQILGWWADGAQPGARRGSALLTGHTSSAGGAAFQDLELLEAGDPVRVRTSAGVVDYRVSTTRIFRKAALAEHAQRLFSQEVPGRLVLVTCEDWNGSVYLSNVVVVAEPAR